MSAIDLRSTTIFIVDGSTSTNTGTVNHSGGYPAANPRGLLSQTMVVTFSIAPSIGEIVTVGGHLQYYEVLAGTTSSLTIFPSLVVAAANSDAIDVVANGIYAKIGEGNLTYSEKRNLVYIRDRGFIDTVKLGDDQPLDVSIDFTWEFLRGTSTTVPSFEEAFKNIGQAASWVSSSVDTCEPYCVEVVIFDIPPCGTDAEKIVLSQFRWESMDHDLKGAKVAVKGTCNILSPTITHSVP